MTYDMLGTSALLVRGMLKESVHVHTLFDMIKSPISYKSLPTIVSPKE